MGQTSSQNAAPSSCPIRSQELSGSGCPVKHDTQAAPARCPVEHSSSIVNPQNQMPSLPQAPAPHQSIPLPISRTESSIPRSPTDKWEYPSPQQFYNALVRKGWETPEEHVETMVDIHNFLNEQAWQEVLKWEKRQHECAFFLFVFPFGRFIPCYTVQVMSSLHDFEGGRVKCRPKRGFGCLRGGSCRRDSSMFASTFFSNVVLTLFFFATTSAQNLRLTAMTGLSAVQNLVKRSATS